MAKFLGVISNSASSPCDDHVLEFTDLELLTNFLFNETLNLLYEFQKKVEFINDREVVIHENSNNIAKIYDFIQMLNINTLQMERDTNEVDCLLCRMENSINYMNELPNSSIVCKCTANLTRNKILDNIVQISEDMNRIEHRMSLVEAHQLALPVKDEFGINNKFLPILDMHTKILEQIEDKACKITDMINTVEQMFINAHKRLIGACYHKVKHDYASDC